MTYNEIIKALESLLDKMRAYESEQASIGKGLVEDIISMYNRQKAEIENLHHNLKCVNTHKEALIEKHKQDEIGLLRDKIKVLETLLECKNSEIDILKNCLREIGTQITVEDMVEPDFEELWNNPTAKIEFRRTDLFLQKAYVYSRKDHILLDKINDALRKVNAHDNAG